MQRSGMKLPTHGSSPPARKRLGVHDARKILAAMHVLKEADCHTKDRVPWPAVLIMSDTTAKYQASFLEDQTWKCYIGQAIPDAPACGSMDEADIARIEINSCNCSESYDQTIYDHFIANDTKRTISFMPPPYLVTGDVRRANFLQLTGSIQLWVDEGSATVSLD